MDLRQDSITSSGRPPSNSCGLSILPINVIFQILDAMLIPCHDIEETVGTLIEKYGRNARICIIPEGPQTIPYL